MVRTKPSRNGKTKRNRTSFQEEKLNAVLREYDILGNRKFGFNEKKKTKIKMFISADSLLVSLESLMKDKLEDLSRMIRTEKNRMPKRILQMRMGDIRMMTGASTFADLDKLSMEPCDAMSSINTSQFSQSFHRGGKDKTAKKLSKADEGKMD